MINSQTLINQWQQSQNKYVYHEFTTTPKRYIEIDTDSTIYLSVSLECRPIHFKMFRNGIDRLFTRQDSLYYERGIEHYYDQIVDVLNYEDNIATINIICPSHKFLDAFIRWEPTIINVIDFLEKNSSIQ